MSIVRTTALRLALVALAALTAWTGIAREVLAGGARHALVITNQAYAGTVGRLENPHHDGRVVAAALESVGFAVTHVRDAGRARFQAAVAEFIATLAKAGPRAAGLFYYSGHGAAVTKYGDNYLIPVDAAVTHAAQLPFLAVKLGEIIEGIAAAGARSNFIVVDACRNTPFAASMKSAHKGFLPERERGGVMIAYATEPGSVALDNHAYARALAREIVRPGQPAVLMFRAVRRHVLEASSNAQFPWTRDGLVEEFYFAGPDGGAAPASGGRGPRARPLQPGTHLRDCAACPELVIVPKGRFTMGSPDDEIGRRANEGPRREIEIPASFAVGVHEVSFREWRACVEAGGCRAVPPDNGWGQGDQPVINVSWDDAGTFTDWLSHKTGFAYRLLTESEWEYVARAGTTTPFWNERALSPADANYDARYGLDGREVPDPTADHYRRRPLAVSTFAANPFGLKNVHGNVWEWVSTCFGGDPGGSTAGRATARDDAPCRYRILRGGSWYDEPARLRAAYRHSLRPATRVATVGFRVARDLGSSAAAND